MGKFGQLEVGQRRSWDSGKGEFQITGFGSYGDISSGRDTWCAEVLENGVGYQYCILEVENNSTLIHKIHKREISSRGRRGHEDNKAGGCS
jgi:hypothetical protein